MLRNLLAVPVILFIFFILQAMGISFSMSLVITAVLVVIYLVISSIIYAKKQKEINDTKVEKKKEDWF